MVILTLILVLGVLIPLNATAENLDQCFESAANRYSINTQLLKAVAITESGLDPEAINRNIRHGSIDVGLMQINSKYWWSELEKHGIKPSDLLDPCVNIHVGAWVLAQKFQEHGYNWKAVGAYNSNDLDKRYKYAKKVEENYRRITTR